MIRRPYVWCEPFAGSAALTYWLLGGKPPISYMGGKSGYSSVIADILGLSQHHPPAGIILGEPGPFAAVHATLGGASGSAEDVASWLTCADLSMKKEPSCGYGAEYERFVSGARFAPPNMDAVAERVGPASHAIANIIRSWKDEEPRALWERLKAKGWPSLLLPEGCRGRWLGPQDPGDVAGWMHANALSMVKDGTACGYSRVNGEGNEWTSRAGKVEHWQPTTVESTVRRIEPATTFPPLAVWQGFAEDLALPADLRGCIIYMDVPYQGTTKYKHGDCPRENVLKLARDYDSRGATVAISEAVRLDLELGKGWRGVQIDHARKGQKRTFSKQQDEWVTVNRPPVHTPGKQLGMF